MIIIMDNTSLPTQPYKGARDFYPEDMRIRNYIFLKWKEVCERFGYEEYDGPFIEPFEIYAAKSGEELVNEQIYSFIDRGDRKVAIRPEMTPTIARMVSQRYSELNYPIRWFSIPNLWRYEKPQKGRLREHFQLNVDIFGIDGVEADIEIIQIIVNLLKEFGADKNMFEIRMGNRILLEDVLKDANIPSSKFKDIMKAIDKLKKISVDDFKYILKEKADLKPKEIDSILSFLQSSNEYILKMKEKSPGAEEILKTMELLKMSGIESYIKYDPSVVRGLDYYTGNVFELFDLSPNNSRAMAGGGRYNNLVEGFIGKRISGVGFGMGDVTFRNFLENWHLLPQIPQTAEYLITVWPKEDDTKSNKYFNAALETADILRKKGRNVILWLDANTKIEKQLKFADKKNIPYAVIIGDDEINNKKITLKDMKEMKQKNLSISEFINII